MIWFGSKRGPAITRLKAFSFGAAVYGIARAVRRWPLLACPEASRLPDVQQPSLMMTTCAAAPPARRRQRAVRFHKRVRRKHPGTIYVVRGEDSVHNSLGATVRAVNSDTLSQSNFSQSRGMISKIAAVKCQTCFCQHVSSYAEKLRDNECHQNV